MSLLLLLLPAPLLVPAVPVLPDVLEPVWPALSPPLVDCPGVAAVPLFVPWAPEVVLLLVPLWPLMEPVPELLPALEPVPALDCATTHALANTRIASTWSKRFILMISLTCFFGASRFAPIITLPALAISTGLR